MKSSEANQIKIASVASPRAQFPIVVREDPRGVELPFQGGVFWIPVWHVEDGVLKIYLKPYQPDGMPGEATIVHENEIQEDQTTDTQNAAHRENPVETAAHPVQQSVNPVQSSVNPVQSSVNPVQSSVAKNQHNRSPNTSGSRAPQPERPTNQPLYLHPDLDAKAKVCEYLQDVNGEHTASTAEIRDALGLAKSTFKWVVDQLIEEGRVEKIGYGLWKRIRS